MESSTFTYATYIGAAPEKVWKALTSSDFTKQYWFGRRIQSDWTEGAAVAFYDEEGNVTDQGTIVKCEPCHLLAYTWLWVEDQTVREKSQVVTFTLRPMGDATKLTLKHEHLLPSDFYDENDGFNGINNGWPAILSNMKTLLEAGRTLSPNDNEIRALYDQLIDSWNSRNVDAFAGLFAEDGEIIGFDGSHFAGQANIASHLGQVFRDHPTPPYVCKVRGVRMLGPGAADLRAIAGMVPPGKSDIERNVNAHHTLIAVKREGMWRIALFQNTPAQFHGRPELIEQMTEELRQLLR